MKKPMSKCSVLLLLTILFMAPGFAAYLLYQHSTWIGTKTNKGRLLSPPIAFSFFKETAKWHIVFWQPSVCKKACMQQVDLLARVRLALGRKLYQVDQWLILGDTDAEPSTKLKQILAERDFNVGYWPSAKMDHLFKRNSPAAIFLVSPENYIILSYALNAKPDDMYKDLKLLLNTETKST